MEVPNDRSILGHHHHSSRAPGHLKLTGEMSDPNTVKILIAGDVRGNLPALYKRVEAVNASPAGPFTALFCVGNFFGESPAAADGDDFYLLTLVVKQVTNATQELVEDG